MMRLESYLRINWENMRKGRGTRGSITSTSKKNSRIMKVEIGNLSEDMKIDISNSLSM